MEEANPYIVFAAAILPALVLFTYIYIKDKYQREPLSQLLKGVFYGFLSTFIAIAVKLPLSTLGIVANEPQTYIGAIWKAFAGAAVPEECAKLLMLWLLLRRNKYFDERFDGIVYAACVGLGFAVTENIEYLFADLADWKSVAVGRAIFAVPAHFFFAVAMGYFYSLVAFGEDNWHNRVRILWVPVMLHTVYDGLLFMGNVSDVLAGVILIVFYIFCYRMWKRGRKRIKTHLEADREKMMFT